MHFDHVLSMTIKAWVNFLSHFMLMNMYITLNEEPMNRRFIDKEYDFIVGKKKLVYK